MKKRFPVLRQKTNSKFDESAFSNICTLQYVTMECIELIDCVNMKKARSSQAFILINSCAE